MGWRERDWARFTAAERRVFYGARRESTTAARSGGRVSGTPRRTSRRALALVVLVAGVLFLLGRYPAGDPFVPALAVPLPSMTSLGRNDAATTPEPFALRLPASAQVGTTLTVTGSGAYGGVVTVRGHWNAQPWKTLATTRTKRQGRWSASLRLSRQGMLNVRVLLPHGDVFAGSVRVTR